MPRHSPRFAKTKISKRTLEAPGATTHERPLERFDCDERTRLRPLATVDPHHVRVVRRRVANDAFIDIDTVRYSVPHLLVCRSVEVWVTACEVRVLDGPTQVVDSEHHRGLWRPRDDQHLHGAPLADLGRSLADYAAIVEGGAR